MHRKEEEAMTARKVPVVGELPVSHAVIGISRVSAGPSSDEGGLRRNAGVGGSDIAEQIWGRAGN